MLIMLPFLTVAQHESGTRKKYVLVSDHIQHQLSSQCTLTAHISTSAELITLWHDVIFSIQLIC
jgi:hypothetical protein